MNIHHITSIPNCAILCRKLLLLKKITSIPNCAILCRKLLLLKIWSFKDSYSPMSNTYFLGSASSTCNKIRNVVRELFISLGVTIFFPFTYRPNYDPNGPLHDWSNDSSAWQIWNLGFLCCDNLGDWKGHSCRFDRQRCFDLFII